LELRGIADFPLDDAASLDLIVHVAGHFDFLSGLLAPQTSGLNGTAHPAIQESAGGLRVFPTAVPDLVTIG
jgi:hypothetical protein